MTVFEIKPVPEEDRVAFFVDGEEVDIWEFSERNAADKDKLNMYGLTPEQFDQMVLDHDNCCAICSAPFGVNPRDLHVDYDHATGKVRGLLCPDCNRGIGLFKDDPQLLMAAVAYLS